MTDENDEIDYGDEVLGVPIWMLGQKEVPVEAVVYYCCLLRARDKFLKETAEGARLKKQKDPDEEAYRLECLEFVKHSEAHGGGWFFCPHGANEAVSDMELSPPKEQKLIHLLKAAGWVQSTRMKRGGHRWIRCLQPTGQAAYEAYYKDDGRRYLAR